MSRKTAKKRAEIAEYTSLIRFLHTTSTQDALPHLLVPSSASVPFFSDSTTPSPFRQLTHLASPDSLLATSPFSGEDMQVKAVRSDLVGNDRIVVQSESREEEIVSIPGSQGKRKERSTWTRWPLLKGDVYIPEWTLQDEIQALASKAIREWINTNATTDPHMNQEALTSQPSQPDESVECSNPIENSPASPTNPQSGMTQAATGDTPMDHVATEDSPVEDNSLESAMLHPGVISGLTLEVENLLSRIFGALAAHLPLVDKSMQDRLQPMDGRAVLDIVGQAGIVDPEIILKVQRQLEGSQYNERASRADDFHPAHLYPPTTSLPSAAITRSEALQRRRRKVAALEEEFNEDVFDFINDPYRKKGTRKRRRKGSIAQMEDA